MKSEDRLLWILIGFGITLLSVPVGLIITFLLIPFWGWLEKRFGIESIGHSGPAGWCYIASFILAVTVLGWLWLFKRKKKRM